MLCFCKGLFHFQLAWQQWVAYPLCLSVGGLLHAASYGWAIQSPSLWPEIVPHHHHLHYTSYLALLHHLVWTWQRGYVSVAGWQWTYSLWCRHISLLLQLAFSTRSPSSVECCISEKLVPWNELTAVVDDVLSLILSTAAVVNTFVFRLGGHTVSVSLKCSQTAFAISDDEHSTSLYEIDKPSECNLSIRSLCRVFKWNITPMYTGNGVSWLSTCPVNSSVLQVCLPLLNLGSWANVIAAWLCFIVDWHLVFAPSRIMFTNDSKVWGIDTL